MDAMRGLDPTSSAFHTQAARNISQVGFGAVRSEKEIREHDDEGQRPEDQVRLSSKAHAVEAEECMDAGAMSGELSEATDELTDDQDEIQARQKRGRERQVTRGGLFEAEGDLRTDQQVNRMKELDDPDLQIHQVLSDIPEANLKAARNVLTGQIHQGQPAQSLTQLKPVEGVGDFQMERAEPAGILEIHDTAHPPATIDPTENVPPEQQSAMAEMMLERKIEALPSDRRAAVDELREAVGTWASENSVDPRAAFAASLHDMAAGWDDEGLQVAAATYRELNAASAA